jgi:hypothetical protein
LKILTRKSRGQEARRRNKEGEKKTPKNHILKLSKSLQTIMNAFPALAKKGLPYPSVRAYSLYRDYFSTSSR